jgi:hypothetical protein
MRTPPSDLAPVIVRAAVEALEEIRRAPLEPELPLDDNAPLGTLDPDALEVLHDTQAVAPEHGAERTIVGEASIDRRRAAILAGGDADATSSDVDSGEEAVGGANPTPDQDVVDDLGRAAGVFYAGGEPLRPEEKEAARDAHRWETDPASAEDYPERLRELRRRGKRR